jgi:K+-transporting ATPase ATPase A chain
MVLILCIPAAMTYTFGRMAGNQKQGWVLLAAMTFLLAAGITTAYASESRPSAAMSAFSVDHGHGNMEGKETRFGVANSALFATVTTGTSCGAVNSMHDSFNPMGGIVPLVNIELGEVVFGGVGAGLFGILMFVLMSVFIAGLMVGRTPEYLGKKIEGKEMKLAMLYILIFPLPWRPTARRRSTTPVRTACRKSCTPIPVAPATMVPPSRGSTRIRHGGTRPSASPCCSAASS